jgi:CheY-like chemotaxis protein
MLAAFEDAVQRARALASGFSACLTLPVRRAALLRAIAVACGRAESTAGADAPETEASSLAPPDRESALAAGELILVAEDNPTNRLVIARQLAQIGFVADLTENGRQALERIATQRYALVITDIHMPEMDGLDLSAAIRDLERVSGRPRVPVVALTADVLIGEAERYGAAGIDDQIRKPASLAELEQTLARWLPRSLAQRARVAAPPVVEPTVTDAKEPEVLNLEQMRLSFGGINPTIIGLLHRFVETTEPLLAAVERAVTARSPNDLYEAAHSALGSSRTAGAEELAALLGELQTAIPSKRWKRIEAVRAKLPAAFERVRGAVARLGEPEA